MNSAFHGVASTILPLAYIFNRDGAVLYTALAVGYLADAYHLALAAGDHDFDFDDHHHRRRSQRASGAIVAITIVLTSIGLPADAVLLLLGVDAFSTWGEPP